jgi:carboxymethylenebutenolidase
MCYDAEAQPPAPPGEAGETHGEDLVLTAADGNRFAAFMARPARPGAAQVLIYPDAGGLFQFYKELALRFAEIGIPALAIDYYGRTAGLTPRNDSFDWLANMQQVKLETLFADAEAGLAYLREQASASQKAIFTLGFCMGGSLSYLSATNQDFDLAGVIAFYGGLIRPVGGTETVLDRAGRIVFPVLGLFGGADTSIPAEAVKSLDEKLEQAGVDHTIITYPGAPHSFFDRRGSEFAEISDDAWKQVLSFIETQSAKG